MFFKGKQLIFLHFTVPNFEAMTKSSKVFQISLSLSSDMCCDSLTYSQSSAGTHYIFNLLLKKALNIYTLKYRIKARACLHVLNFLPHPDRTFSTLIAYQFLTFCPTLLAYFIPARLSILADFPHSLLNLSTLCTNIMAWNGYENH